MSYVEGFVIAVPEKAKDEYVKSARMMAVVLKEVGATEVVECWEDDVKDGSVTDFRRAVKAEAGEKVVFSWIRYPSRAVRDAATASIMADPRMKDMPMVFDGKRMVIGGFETVFEQSF